MKKTIYLIIVLASVLLINQQQVLAQVSFTNVNSKLVNPDFHSGCPVSVTDWNGDGLDDIVRMDDGRYCYVEVQQINNQFASVYLGDFGGGAWAMTVADVDHNGYKDVVADGSNGIGLLKTNNTGTGGMLIVWLPSSTFFLQNATFGDFNNDGWADLFCCDDNAASHIYLNNGSGGFALSSIINFSLPNGSDISGNYGSVWTDFDNDGDLDLYIAKCRQGVGQTTDPRRIDVLFVNDGANNFTEMAATYGVANGWQTWTASFGDLDNDGDLDLLATNHDHESQIFQNDGTGHYTDITSTTGFDITDITPIESVIEDFNNDGYNDLLITGSDSRFYVNNGNMTFTKIDNIFNNDDMESFAIGDINHDGFVDIYASYATIYTNPTSIDDVIWINDRNANHFLTLNLKGTVSNIGAIGAKAFLYSSLGTQVREVRSGESYGTCNSGQLHFGLGSVTTIDSVVVRWPSGTTQTLINPAADQFIRVVEGDCVSPSSNITVSGPLLLCPGQTLTLDAPAGYTYLWSDGSTTQSINVTATGEYSVQVSDVGNNCVGTSPTVSAVYNPAENPVITASASVEFCDGATIDLIGPAGLPSYLWSDGSTTQNITVSQGGSYTLSVQGLCQMWPSNTITTTVHTPTLPVANDVTLTQPGSTTLTATGNNISWYDAVVGGTLLGTGNNYTTPVLNDTTTYYVQSAEVYTLNEATGITYGPNTFSAANAVMQFTATTDCILKSVKVYTDTPGDRLIELRDPINGLINSQLINIVPDSQVVMLNFPLTAGTNYTLGTNAATNQSTLGQVSPRLARNNSGVNYPYTVQNVLSITGSDQGSAFYYYFYDWQIEITNTCPSAYVPVTVFVTGSVGVNEAAASGIKVYPNPASDKLYIEHEIATDFIVTLTDQSGRTVKDELMNKSGYLDVSNVAAGIYSLKLQNEAKQFIYKVVIN